jgi:hypothetical protein
MRIRKNKKVIRLTESDLRRITKKVINEQPAKLFGYLFKKLGLNKKSSMAIELLLDKTLKYWGKEQDKILKMFTDNNTNLLKNYVSRNKNIPIEKYREGVVALLKQSAEHPDIFLKDIDNYMKLAPREIIDKNGNVIKFRENFKLFLTDVTKQKKVLEKMEELNLSTQGAKKVTKKSNVSGLMTNYGKARNNAHLNEIVNSATGGISQIGKKLDRVGINVYKDLTKNNIKKIGTIDGRTIYEVTYPTGDKLRYWKSTGGGKKSVKFSPKNSQYDAPNSKDYFGVVAGEVDASAITYINPKGELKSMSDQWFIKDNGWEIGYGSITVEDTGLWLKNTLKL